MSVLTTWWNRLTRRGDEQARALAGYAAACARASAADREKRALRKLVDAIPADEVHGGWRKRFGTPARIVDADRVRELLAEHGHTVPMKDAAAPLIVEYVGQGEG